MKARGQAHRTFGEEGHTFLFGLSDGRVIGGSLNGNSARWLNHACAANCEAVETDSRVYIEAIADIKAGEELFVANLVNLWNSLGSAISVKAA